jgi:hypothetical protein
MRVSAARIGVLMLFAPVALLLGAGTTARILALSPDNREAQDIGPLNAYLEGQNGSGAIWLKMRDGEVLRGQFTVKVGGSFGAYGKSRGLDRPGAAYTGRGRAIEGGGSPGFVDMKGHRGATVHCEVVNDDLNAHGNGVCRFSNGAEYRVLY